VAILEGEIRWIDDFVRELSAGRTGAGNTQATGARS
jgi:hypothetical protein